jgi:hypothetical protein
MLPVATVRVGFFASHHYRVRWSTECLWVIKTLQVRSQESHGLTTNVYAMAFYPDQINVGP